MKQIASYLTIVIYLLLTVTPSVQARDLAVVEVVKGKVVLERNDEQQPLVVDMILQNGDIITTAENARVWLTFQDDSMLKLGEKSRFALDRFIAATKDKPEFSATFSLMKGVFRFFTNTETERDIQVNVAQSITLGIRGTDLFVGATPEKDWICLVKGIIQVQASDQEITLNKPRQFLVVPKDKSPLPIQQVSDEQFAKWVKSTELPSKD